MAEVSELPINILFLKSGTLEPTIAYNSGNIAYSIVVPSHLIQQLLP